MSTRSERITIVGRQRCPRRDEGVGYREQSPEADAWERGRWAANQAEADAEAADFMSRHPTGGISAYLAWRWDGEQPRTCSFCGGIHPDDATALMRAGWHLGVTDKSYKRYMDPPDGAPLTPPVKLYVQHFSAQQIDAFNAAMRGDAP